MKLDKSIPFLSGLGDDELEICFDLMHRLPCRECINTPNTVVIENEGSYYLIKARGGVCENPYDVEFNEYSLEEVRQECNPLTEFAVPEGFEGQNVLIRI